MKKIKDLKRKIIRYFCTGVCLTTAAFIFQACYGMPRGDYDREVRVQGKVLSATTNTPLPNIKVSLKRSGNLVGLVDTTKADGTFFFFTPVRDLYDMRFESIDNEFLPKDTVLTSPAFQIEFNIRLDAQ